MRILVVILAILWATPGWAAGAIVRDGNTVQLADMTYRLDGIDAPKFDQVCIDEHADPWACGVEARDQLAKLIAGRDVHCKDLGLDKTFKRHIGDCNIDGEKDGLSRLLVRRGYALNLELSAKGQFSDDEAGAKSSRLGLWRGCFVAPQAFRHWDKATALLGSSCRTDKDLELREALFPAEPAAPPGCSIKAKYVKRAHFTGHVGIYQMQGCRSYAGLTKPDRWFCSADDAQAAGFRRAFNCFAGTRRRQ